MKCSNLLRMKAGRKVKTWQHKLYLRSFYTGDSNFKLVFIAGIFQLMQSDILEIARIIKSLIIRNWYERKIVYFHFNTDTTTLPDSFG